MDEQSLIHIENALNELYKASEIELNTGDKFGISEAIAPSITRLSNLCKKINAGEI